MSTPEHQHGRNISIDWDLEHQIDYYKSVAEKAKAKSSSVVGTLSQKKVNDGACTYTFSINLGRNRNPTN